MSEASRLWRRVWNTLGFGTVSLIDDSAEVQKAQLQTGSVEIHDDVPVVQLFGLSGNAPAGAQAVVLFVGGDRANPVAIATNHQGSRPTGLQPGETKLYDAAAKYVYLSSTGITIEAAGLPVTVNTPLLKVSGDIIDNYGTNTHNMAAMRTLYDEHTHGVPNAATGTSTLTTTVPTPQE